MIILPRGPLVLRTDTIEPVIGSAEVAAGITNDGNIEVFQCAENVLAEAVLVGEWVTRVIDTAVDASAHVPIESGLVCCSMIKGSTIPTGYSKQQTLLGIDSAV